MHKTILRTTACILGFGIVTIPAKAYTTPTIEEKSIVLNTPAESPFLAQLIRLKKVEEAEIKQIAKETKKKNEAIRLSHSQLISVLKEAGFKGHGLKMAWAIVQKESNGRPYAHNNNSSTGDNSYGIFQINMMGSMGPDRREKYGLESNEDLFDPLTNAKIAFKMSRGGEAWGAWTTHQKAEQILSDFPG